MDKPKRKTFTKEFKLDVIQQLLIRLQKTHLFVMLLLFPNDIRFLRQSAITVSDLPHKPAVH